VADRSRIAEVVAASLVSILARAKMPTYPQSRWTGAAEAFDAVVLLEAIHGLGAAVWPLWAAEARDATASSRPPAAPLPRPELPMLVAPNMNPGEEPMVVDAAASGPEELHTMDTSVEFDPRRAQVENDTHRREASLFMASQPLGLILVVRHVLEPFRRLLGSQLAMTGDAFEAKQQQAEAKAMAASSSSAPVRSYPVVEAASQKLETKFLAEISLLMSHSNLWMPVVPERDRTFELRGLAFRMLSAAACVVQASIGLKHRCFPIKAFTCLARPELAASVFEVPDCLLDEWSRAFKSHFESDPGGLSGDAAMATMRLTALLCMQDIAGVEAKHASLRRRLVGRSVQTHCIGLEEASAEVVAQRVRSRGTCWSSEPWMAEPPSKAGCEEPPAKVHRYGGPWRAYIREQSLGTKGRPNTTLLKEQYRNLAPEEKSRLQGLGDAARESRLFGSTGQSSFGLKTSELRLAKRQQFLEASGSKGLSQLVPSGWAEASPGEQCQLAIDRSLRAGVKSMGALVSSARAIVQASRRATLAEQRVSEEVLHAWVQSHGRERVKQFVGATSGLQNLEHALSGVPSSSGSLVAYQHPTWLTAAVSRSVLEAGWKSNNFGKALMLDWQAKHDPILHASCPPIDAKLPTRSHPPC